MSRVALIGENSIEYVSKLIDMWNDGDCAVLIDWRIPFQTVVEIMKEANVNKCYMEKKLFDKKTEEMPVNMDLIFFEKKKNTAEYLPEHIYNKFKPNYTKNEAIVLYSSGTTGKAKGIILSHFAINTNADAIIDYMKPNVDDCIYIAKTLSHSSTLTGELLVALKTNIKLIIAQTIVPPRYILNNIKNFNVSIICLNPTLISMIADEYKNGNYNISSLKTIYVSGSILNDKIYAKAHSIFNNIQIYNVYGLSETGPRVTAQRKNCCKNTSVGKPIKNVEVKIIDECNKEAGRGEEGNVYIKTPSIFLGYITKNEKLKSRFNDWFNTGDIGYIDTNDELYIIGRQDDMIIIDSYKIYPYYIEKIILNHDKITECKVIGTEKYDLACVYSKSTNENITNELIKLLNRKLALYEMPSKFICVEDIPKTNNGKIDINKIKKYVNEGESKYVQI